VQRYENTGNENRFEKVKDEKLKKKDTEFLQGRTIEAALIHPASGAGID